MANYSQKKIQQLLSDSDSATTTYEKGNKLEELTIYIFDKVPGVSFHDKNILDGARAHEIDVAFWNPPQSSDLSFLDSLFIVECKNHETPISSRDVGWFVRKLQDRGIRTAILVSLSGITGSANGESNAHSEVLTALIRDRIKILVLSREELLQISKTEDLVDKLQEKFISLTLEKTVSLDS